MTHRRTQFSISRANPALCLPVLGSPQGGYGYHLTDAPHGNYGRYVSVSKDSITGWIVWLRTSKEIWTGPLIVVVWMVRGKKIASTPRDMISAVLSAV